MTVTAASAVRQRGFTIVEFMVALLLGTVLIGGAISIYLASSRSSQETERSLELLDSGRFAMQVLSNTLRHAGFLAGVAIDRSGVSNPSGDCTADARAFDLRTYLLAEVADPSGNAFGGCVDDAMPGTEVLLVKHLVPAPVPVADWVATPAVLNPDRVYAAVNWVQGELFNGASPPTGYPADSAAWPYSFQVFYIRSEPDPVTNDPVPVALARKFLTTVGGSLTVVGEDLISGAEDMRVRFRYDSDDDGDMDRAGYEDDIIDWDLVGAVEVFLLLRSDEDPDYVDDKAYTLGDRTVTPLSTPDENPPDRWRLLMNQYITLRNPNLVIQR